MKRYFWGITSIKITAPGMLKVVTSNSLGKYDLSFLLGKAGINPIKVNMIGRRRIKVRGTKRSFSKKVRTMEKVFFVRCKIDTVDNLSNDNGRSA